jgi:hypothetical protein
MLRKTVYATLIVILTMGAASVQTGAMPSTQGITGYGWRTEKEKKNDRDIDGAYQSTMERLPNKEKKKSGSWDDVRPTPPAAAKNKPQ